MRQHASFGLSPDQAGRLFSGIMKRACIMENEPGGPVSGTKAERHGPSEPVQVVSTVSHGGHEGRGASPSSPGLQAKALSSSFPPIRTGTYTHGALLREIKQASEFMAPDNYTIQKRVRAGHTATGHLPSAPDVGERIVEGTYSRGDLQRMLKTAAPGPAFPVMADETPNRAGTLMDYATRAAVGAGIGRTLGFLRGGLSPAVERRLGVGGAIAGLALAEASRREAQRHEAAVNTLRQMAESSRGDAGSGAPLRDADSQMRTLLEQGARAEGLM